MKILIAFAIKAERYESEAPARDALQRHAERKRRRAYSFDLA